jgi:PAS domain S-box-containing protein
MPEMYSSNHSGKKMSNKQKYIISGRIHLQLVLFAKFCSLLVFIFFIWLIQVLLGNIPFNIPSIILIHKNNPALWIVDLIPFIGAYLFYYFDRLIRRKEQEYAQNLKSVNKSIEVYTDYAKSIGEGNYNFLIRTQGPEDELGEALVLLQNNLRTNKKKESDQDWILQGKDMISRILRLHNKLDEMAFEILRNLINYIQAVQGAFYVYDEERNVLVITASYAYNRKKYLNQEFKIGQGLVGACAYEMDFVYRTEIPEDYVSISSGLLGDSKPRTLLFIPLITDEKLQGVIEFASLDEKIPKLSIQFLLELGEIIARTIYNLKINQKTELLLRESRTMTEELQENEQTLKENAEIMQSTQEQLRKTNEQLEAKIMEVQNAQGRLHWLLENSSEVISIYKKDLMISYISPSVARILGYTPEEMMQGKDFERLTLEGAKDLKNLIQNAIADPNLLQIIKYSFIKRNGEIIYLESTAKNLLDDPSINGIIVNTIDITERIRAEKEERLKTRMQSLSENSLDMIMRLNISGQFHYANPVVEDYTGIESSKLINKNFSEIEFVPVLREFFETHLPLFKTNPKKTNTEISIPVKLGEKLTERILSIDAIPEFTNNELETILFVGHDITEAKRIAKEIQIKNKNIEDSINYAERIQSALLPTSEHIKKYLEKSFVLFKPRDVVSGDFPWFYVKNGEIYIAVVDCTGHGVPGALLSFIGFFLLNNIVDKYEDKSAGQICDLLHTNVRYTLKQDLENRETRDGMDIAFCKINVKNKIVQFAGAHRPLYHYSDGELTEYKGDRKSVGGINPGNKLEENFTNQFINIKKGDKIFLFSDGLSDQLGGPYGRKYTSKRIMDNILANTGFSPQQYHDFFENDFTCWKEGFKQLDDMLLIGIEF